VKNIIAEKLPLTPASNYAVKLRQIALELLRTNDSVIMVDIQRSNVKKTVKVECIPRKYIDLYYKYHIKDTCYKLINSNVAYINPFFLKTSFIPELLTELKKAKGIIIDFRYPPAENILSIADILIKNPVNFVKLTAPKNDFPGLFTFFYTMQIGNSEGSAYNGKVILLNNEFTQSSSEFNTMAFRKYKNAFVVGSTTAGADGDVADLYLPGGILTSFSGLGVYHDNNRETQQVGIIPDINFRPTIKGLREGKDELLQFAVSLIEK
jgi:C-terminal processing protease CtpA/Prc